MLLSSQRIVMTAQKHWKERWEEGNVTRIININYHYHSYHQIIQYLIGGVYGNNNFLCHSLFTIAWNSQFSSKYNNITSYLTYTRHRRQWYGWQHISGQVPEAERPHAPAAPRTTTLLDGRVSNNGHGNGSSSNGATVVVVLVVMIVVKVVVAVVMAVEMGIKFILVSIMFWSIYLYNYIKKWWRH